MQVDGIFFIPILFWPVVGGGAKPARLDASPPTDSGEVRHQPPLPQSLASPDGRWLLLTQRPAMPTIADLSQPMLRLAGTRISPRTNSAFQTTGIMRLTLVDLSTNRTQVGSLPPNPHIP